MRYSSSSASRSPCCPRATRSRRCSADSSTVRSGEALIPLSYPASGAGLTRLRSTGGKTYVPGAHDPLVIGDLRDDDVEWAVLRLEDDDRGATATTAERGLERVGGARVDEGG